MNRGCILHLVIKTYIIFAMKIHDVFMLTSTKVINSSVLDCLEHFKEVFWRYICVMCVTPPGQAKNDTDLKFGTHISLKHI